MQLKEVNQCYHPDVHFHVQHFFQVYNCTILATITFLFIYTETAQHELISPECYTAPNLETPSGKGAANISVQLETSQSFCVLYFLHHVEPPQCERAVTVETSKRAWM